ncbi:MAG TPA: HAD family hydrolase [Planctomycetaceae bacterium]|jgi:FMN phosphatase YigB (HAD superfamily)|nr:HAD family hydrolase [Planctomycetaceae bacterium]
MAQALLEYADWLDERELLWPTPPDPVPVKATPYLEGLPDVRAVTWGAYGTLLLVSDGRLQPVVPNRLRMEVALERTIEEFNMWHSMSRKPGAPWEYMLHQLQNLVDHRKMAGTGHRGEAPEVDLAKVWQKLIERLQQKGYEWDRKRYGALDDFSAKVAFFFQSCLQGVRAAPHALEALLHVREAGCRQGIIGDGQVFTLVQLLRGLRGDKPVPPLTKLFSAGCVSLSYQFGVRQPAETLFRACLANLARHQIASREVLHVASRLKEELVPAKRLGMKTALYAGDNRSLEATAAEINDPHLRPDRILTDLKQIRQIVREE